MAAPKANASKPDDPRQAKTRAAIRTTQLVNRLERFALEEPGNHGEVIEIDSNRLRAIEILLRKALPDLSNVNFEGSMTHGVSDTLAALMDSISERQRRVTDRD